MTPKPTPTIKAKKPVIQFAPEEISPQPAQTTQPTPLTPKTQPTIKQPEAPTISFPSISLKSAPSPTSPLGSTPTRTEEDRATGIAILRKQMLSELKKIRAVVSDADKG